MENRIVFREMLTEIKKVADQAGNRITKGEIQSLLSNMPLTEEHYKLIYEYLSAQNIRVVDSEEEAEELPEENGQRSLTIYLEELEALEQSGEENEQELFDAIRNGDQAAKERLIEKFLPIICSMAGDYEGDDLPPEDLIQEGNLGLLMAIETLEGFESPAACRAHILNEINDAMEHAIEESKTERQGGNGIVNRVNHLNEAVQNLERDLEHKVSPQELSAYLEMPLEEIKDILRMSGDQIEVEGN